MKHVARMLAAVAAVALLGGGALAAPKKAKPKMETFLIETAHNDAECMAAMDEVIATQGKNKKKEPAMFSNTVWGCLSGDHRGWTTTKAATQEDALKVLPESMRAGAKVVQVSKFTVKDIKAAKKKMEKEKAGT